MRRKLKKKWRKLIVFLDSLKIKNAWYMFKTGASIKSCMFYLKFNHDDFNYQNGKKYDSVKADYLKENADINVTMDWFTPNIISWMFTLDSYYPKNSKIEALEIGSFEGRSANFLLWYNKQLNLTCVDIWDKEKIVSYGLTPGVEDRFDSNVSQFGDRVKKFKGTSLSFFNSLDGQSKLFDFIYVDGSHYVSDVMVDAIMCFELLKIGGVMIFDDYLWLNYSRLKDNPCSAINAFLSLKEGDYEIIYFGYQLHIVKTKDRTTETQINT